MPVSLTIFPLAEPQYNGGLMASDHALFFRTDCSEELFRQVMEITPAQAIDRLHLNFDVRGRETILRAKLNTQPLKTVPVGKLADVLSLYVTDDRNRRSHAVVSFLRQLPSDLLAVPWFN